MARRHDELIEELRDLLRKALAGVAVGARKAAIEELLGDHRTGLWPEIEAFGSESWMIGRYEGRGEGLKAAQAILRERAGAAFVAGNDYDAKALRKLADDMTAEIARADAEAAAQRSNRGH